MEQYVSQRLSWNYRTYLNKIECVDCPWMAILSESPWTCPSKSQTPVLFYQKFGCELSSFVKFILYSRIAFVGGFVFVGVLPFWPYRRDVVTFGWSIVYSRGHSKVWIPNQLLEVIFILKKEYLCHDYQHLIHGGLVTFSMVTISCFLQSR